MRYLSFYGNHSVVLDIWICRSCIRIYFYFLFIIFIFLFFSKYL